MHVQNNNKFDINIRVFENLLCVSGFLFSSRSSALNTYCVQYLYTHETPHTWTVYGFVVKTSIVDNIIIITFRVFSRYARHKIFNVFIITFFFHLSVFTPKSQTRAQVDTEYIGVAARFVQSTHDYLISQSKEKY